jgi:hypothetical protein
MKIAGSKGARVEMPSASFPPHKCGGGIRCRISPLRQKAGFLPDGTYEEEHHGVSSPQLKDVTFD